MEILAIILFNLSIYIFIPVIIARVLLYAEWRTIGNAYVLWYVFLFVVFGKAGLQDVLMVALLWSIPAVPVITLVLQLSNSLRSWFSRHLSN